MSPSRVRLKFFLDENVQDSVGDVLRQAGHEVIHLRQSGVATGSPDPLVCTIAEINDCILVSYDGDIKVLAKGHGVTPARFKKLSVIKLNCVPPEGVARMRAALSLIELEWAESSTKASQRRIFVEVGTSYIRTLR